MKGYHHLDASQIKRIASLLQQSSLSIREIAKRLDISDDTVRSINKRLNIRKPNSRKTLWD